MVDQSRPEHLRAEPSKVDPPKAEHDLHDLALTAELRRELGALPRELVPQRDLWPAIHARLPTPTGRGRLEWARPRYLVAAALLAGLVGAWLIDFESDFSPSAPTPVAVVERPTAGAPVDPAIQPANLGKSPTAARSWSEVETDFARSRQELLVVVQARRSQLAPDTVKIIEKNLAIIDAAIAELRQALADDPSNQRLNREWLEHQRRSLELLRHLADEA